MLAAVPDEQPVALISTLGGKPQVVTFALDALLALGARVERVCLVHLSAGDPRIQRSLDILHSHIPQHYARRAPRVESMPVRASPPPGARGTYAATQGRAIERADDPAAPDAAWMTMQRLIGTLKAEGRAIELCVTGGPRLIGLQALAAATLLLTPQDRCWHLYTPAELRAAAGEGDILHDAGGGIRLVAVPLLPLGLFVPALRQAAFLTPEDLLAAGRRWMSAQDERRCREVIRELTPRQREVLREFARGAGSVAEVARRLGVSAATVNTHKTPVLDACRAVWEVGAGERMSFHFLREHFGSLPDEAWAAYGC